MVFAFRNGEDLFGENPYIGSRRIFRDGKRFRLA
jgi:hypothetical protein